MQLCLSGRVNTLRKRKTPLPISLLQILTAINGVNPFSVKVFSTSGFTGVLGGAN